MLRNFSSTCNSKMGYSRDRMDHYEQKLPQSESKVREISKPVKIAHLLGLSSQLQAGLKDSTTKISQPERITPYMRNTSTKKKKGVNIANQCHQNDRSVRRNLTFTEIPRTVKETKQTTKTSTNNLLSKSTVNSTNEKSSHSRKSLILPPNSIKNMHVSHRKKKLSKSMIPHVSQVRIVMEKSVGKYSRISEGSETSSPPIQSSDIPVNKSDEQEKNIKTSVIQHTSLQTFKANSQPNLNTLNLPSSDLAINVNNDMVGETPKCLRNNKTSKINVSSNPNRSSNVANDKLSPICITELKKNTKLYDGSYLDLGKNVVYTPGVEKINTEDLCVSLQTIKKLSKSCTDLQHDIHSEYVTVNKKEFITLASSLEHLICKLEENISNLKLASACVVNFLSANATIIKDEKIKREKVASKNSSDNGEVIDNTSTSLLCASMVANEVDQSPKASKTLDFDACPEINVLDATKGHEVLSSQETENNKENENDTSLSEQCSKPQPRRRSARLMAMAMKNSSVDDSFVTLENELCIINKECVTPVTSCNLGTSMTSGCKDKKKGRPWKEYMALKSRMSCLLTPNIKRFNLTESKDNLHPETGSNGSGNSRTCLSSKILADLHNLYSDSPDL